MHTHNVEQRGRSGCTARTPAAQPQNELHEPRCSRPRLGRCAAAPAALAPVSHVYMHGTAPVLRGSGVAGPQHPNRQPMQWHHQPNLRPVVHACGTRCGCSVCVLFRSMLYMLRTARVQRRASTPTPPNRPPGKCLDEGQFAGVCVCPCAACRHMATHDLCVMCTVVLCAIPRRGRARPHSRQHRVCTPTSSGASSVRPCRLQCAS